MHSLFSRGNAVLTTATTVLFVVCAATSLTDLFFEPQDVDVTLELTRVEQLGIDKRSRNDFAALDIFLDADLRGAFSWNTKQLFLFVQAEYSTAKNQLNQVVLWDTLLTKKKRARVKKQLPKKYLLYDDGQNLKDLSFNLTVAWNVMPKVGRLYMASKTFSNFQLPSEYGKYSKS